MTNSNLGKIIPFGGVALLLAAAFVPASGASVMDQALELRGGSLGRVYDGAVGSARPPSPVRAQGFPTAANLGGSSPGSPPLLDQANVPSISMGAAQDSSSGGGEGLGHAAGKVLTGGVMAMMGFGIGGALLGPVGALAGAGLGLLAADGAMKGSSVARGAAKVAMSYAGASVGASVAAGILGGAAHGALLGPLGLLAGAVLGGVAGYMIAKHATGGGS